MNISIIAHPLTFKGIYLESNLRRIWWELLERIKNVKLRRLTPYKAFTRGGQRKGRIFVINKRKG